MLRPFSLFLIVSVAVCGAEIPRADPSASPANPTICIEPMGGLEVTIAKTLLKASTPPKLVLPHEPCDILVSLKRKYHSRWIEALVAEKTGRRENAELTAIDLRSGRVLARRDLKIRENGVHERSLESFAEHLSAAVERETD